MTYFFDRCFEKKRMKKFLIWIFRTKGASKTLELLELLKKIGFKYSTLSGLSIGLEDLKLSINKTKSITLGESKGRDIEYDFKRAYLNNFEKIQQTISLWIQINEMIKQKSISSFQISQKLNSLYLMAFSGARGNISQVRQLVGMRGLMSDPQGNILDFPIRSNFREGLTLTEYIISCYGARKGIVDTALRTATSGYLTRRLVDVAQHVIIEQLDCQTNQCIWMEEYRNRKKLLIPIQSRILGRVLSKTIIFKNSPQTFFRNMAITPKMSHRIGLTLKKVPIRSPLTCQTLNSVCQLCYGWNLSSEYIVSLGEAVGVLAAQSIGEPGTQLTMRTFHTGGVFAGEIIEQIFAPIEGVIFFKFLTLGNIVRNSLGQICFLTKQDSILGIISSSKKKKVIICIPKYSFIFVKHGEIIDENQLISQFDISTDSQPKGQKTYVEQDLCTDSAGQIFFENLTVLEKRRRNLVIRQYTQSLGTVWIIPIFQFELNNSINTLLKPFDFIISKLPIFQFQLNINTINTKYEFEYLENLKEHYKVEPDKNAFTNCYFSFDYESIIFFNKFYFFLSPDPNKYYQSNKINFKLKLSNLIGGINKSRVHKQLNFCFHYFYIFKIIARTQVYDIFVNDFLIRISYQPKQYPLFDQFHINSYSFWKFNKLVLYPLRFGSWSIKTFKNGQTVTILKKKINRKIFFIKQARNSLTKHKSNNLYFLQLEILVKRKINKLILLDQSRKNLNISSIGIFKYGRYSSLNYFEILNNLVVFRLISSNRRKKKKKSRKKINFVIKLKKYKWFCNIPFNKIRIQLTPHNKNQVKLIFFDLFKNYNNFNQFYLNYQFLLDQNIDFKYSKEEIIYWKKLINLFYFYKTSKNSTSRFRIQRVQLSSISSIKIIIEKLQSLNLKRKYNNNNRKVFINNSYFNKSKKTNLSIQLNPLKSINYQILINATYFQLNKNQLTTYLFNYLNKIEISPLNFIDQIYKKYNQIHFIEIFYVNLPTQLIANSQLNYRIIKKRRRNNKSLFFVHWDIHFETLGCIFSIQKNNNSQILNILFLDNFTIYTNLKYYGKIGHFIHSDDINTAIFSKQGQIYGRTLTDFIIRYGEPKLLASNGILHVPDQSILPKNTRYFTFFYTYYKTGDIVQGIPKIEEFFEARNPFEIEFGSTNLQNRLDSIYKKYKLQYKHKYAVRKSILQIQQIVIEGIQSIYLQQGVVITDKHLEIIIRQMTSKVRIISSGSTGLLFGEIVDIKWIEILNSRLRTNYIDYEPIILGITRSSLETNSFISASSFQETIRILTKSAVQHKMDFLCGLKENIILGHLIPAGTGSLYL